MAFYSMFARFAQFLPGVLSPLRLTALGCAIAVAPTLHAQSSVTNTFEELSQNVKAPKAIHQVGADLFGDQVNLYNGKVEFVQTDIDLKGNSALQVRLGRRAKAGVRQVQNRAFGHWELDIPYISGVFSSSKGWTVAGSSPGARCSSYGAPLGALDVTGTVYFDPEEFWQGNSVYVPGHGEQRLLARMPNNYQTPSPNTSYPVVTSRFWSVSCLPTLANSSTGGEGFLVIAPDGTKYRFDHMVSYTVPSLQKPYDSAALKLSRTALLKAKKDKPGSTPVPMAPTNALLYRKEVRLLPTVITDRYGNTVTYTYDPANPTNVTKITANDGRVLNFTYAYSGNQYLITSVNDTVRTWNYSYHVANGFTNLDRVTLPDNSFWNFANTDQLFFDVAYINQGNCSASATLNSYQRVGTMVHPTGATGTFTLKPTTHGRANVIEACVVNVTTGTEYALYPRYFYTNSLGTKAITGAGLPGYTWSYDYGPVNASWTSCSGCDRTKTVTVTEPTATSRHIFSNDVQSFDGRVIKVEEGWNGASALRTTQSFYRAPGAGPYSEYAGVNDPANMSDSDLSERYMPLERTVITQQGATFTWQANSFDTYARATNVTRSSSLGHNRTEATIYHDNTSKWVIGQVASVTETGTGAVMVSHTYDPTTANLLSTSRFGKLQESYTYHTTGNLWTRKDGLNQTTTYTNYKAGLPQNTQYANGNAESAVVSNIGLISSTTVAGFTTSYGYDAVGRLSSITPPAGDTVAWNPTTIVSENVASAEYGLAAGHWRQTVSKGNYRQVSYFDALWRPVLVRAYDAADEANTRSMVLNRFDSRGNATFVSYPQRTITAITDSVNGTTTTFDALARPSNIAANSELGVLNTGFAYLGGFTKQVTNPRNFATTYAYQAFDQPSESAIITISEPLGISTQITRDVFGKTTQISKGDGAVSATKKYVYDSFARLCKTIEPEGITVQDYNAANQVAWHAYGQNTLTSATSCDQASVPAAQKVNYGYDTRNRLLNTTFADGSAGITRTYTPDSQLATISANGAVWTYGYNRRRLLDTETLTYLRKTYITRHGFDANGSESTLTYPDAAATVMAYSPNALGQPSQVGIYVNAVKYHPNGAVASFNYSNGITHTMTPNVRGLPQQVVDTGVLNDTYSYDQNGNVTGITDNQENIATRGMTYTAVDYLHTVTAANLWGTATYANDALGNLRGVTISSGPTARSDTINYDPATNRVHNISNSIFFTYDRQGNIKQRGSDAYVFDGANRMTSATGKASYVYDGNGRRVAINQADGTKQIQVYTQAGLLVMGTSQVGTGAVTETRYGYLNDSQVAELGNHYTHTDGLRSPVAKTDGARTVLSRTRYEPYGKTAAGATPTIGFTGHVNDANTGLIYMQQRYYDPIAGRFLSIDPVLTDANSASSFNRYNYANNSPYKYVDPDGRFAFLIPLVPYIVGGTATAVVGHYVLPGRQQREDSARKLGNAILNDGNKDTGTKADDKKAPTSPHIDPKDVGGKTPAEIDKLAGEKGLQPKGPDPQGGRGAYVDPVTGEQRVLVHPGGSCPHCHVNNPQGERLDINGNVVPAESPAAHLPLGKEL